MLMGTFFIVIASIMWGAVHSVLASHVFKEMVRRSFGAIVFGRLYRFSYNLFSLVSFLPLILMLITFPDQVLYKIPSPWIYLTTIVQGIAALALMAGVMQTGPMEFAGLAQLAPGYEDLKQGGLVVDGLYSWVRHPLYTAGLVFIWLTSEMTLNRLVLWIVFTLYILIGAYFEERKLLKDFGAQYADYRSRTPMLIPSWKRKA